MPHKYFHYPSKTPKCPALKKLGISSLPIRALQARPLIIIARRNPTAQGLVPHDAVLLDTVADVVAAIAVVACLAVEVAVGAVVVDIRFGGLRFDIRSVVNIRFRLGREAVGLVVVVDHRRLVGLDSRLKMWGVAGIGWMEDRVGWAQDLVDLGESS